MSAETKKTAVVYEGSSSEFRQALNGIVRQTLPVACYALAVVYIIFAFSHRVFLPLEIGGQMASIAALSAALFLAGGWWLGRHVLALNWVHPVASILVFLVFSNCFLHLYLTDEARQTTNFFFLILGSGFLLLDTRWFVAFLIPVWSGWLWLAWAAEPRAEWFHFGFGSFTVTCLALTLHLLYVRQVGRYERLHRMDVLRQEALVRSAAQARAANVAKSEFLANMSHELRTPLNAVIGFTNVLQKNRAGRLVAQDLKYLERISANGRHLLDLIDQLLDLSRIEAGRLSLDLSAVALDELVTETLGSLKPLAEESGLWLKQEVPLDPAPIEVDRGRLRQVLINLVSNGLKFTDQGGVTLRLQIDEDRYPVALEVIDTGIGIASEQQEKIFEAFEQLESGRSRRYAGSGLGLPISHALCKLMGLQLEVESQEQEGSTFRIIFARPKTPRI